MLNFPIIINLIAIAIIRRFSHRLADAIMYQVAKYGMPVVEDSENRGRDERATGRDRGI